MTDRLSPLEVGVLAGILDELDYYQLLEVPRAAPPADVKQAYYASARSFHPDANRELDGGVLARCERISKRITEAYCVLRDPRQRAAYDERLAETGRVRIQLASARVERKRAEQETRQGATPQGRQFFRLALQEADRGNLDAALQKVQIALTFEPANSGFAAQRDEWKTGT